MGEIIRLKCENKDMTGELRIGQGLKDNDPDVILENFPDAKRDRIRNAIDTGKIWNYRRVPALCKKCGSLTTVSVFETVGEEALSVVGKCECGHEAGTAVMLNVDDGVKVSCPECGGSMEIETIGFWD
ncbi:MAG: hypothetical protein K5857_05820 [Lachnospiraceae bacterium]|nr:hypothetical protein [Lachnospiraceae bacterium]